MLTAIFFINRRVFGLWSLFPLFFAAFGFCFMIPGIISAKKNRKIIESGKRISAKIYGYVEDKHVVINGGYAVNTLVRYFDDFRRTKGAVIETGFVHGSNAYPIGMTVDIYMLDGRIGWDAASVRQETLFEERVLMDRTLEAGADDEVIAVECPKCGGLFCTIEGYADRCPYCKEDINPKNVNGK